MTPLMMRVFTLVGIALAAASMQSKARADSLPHPVAGMAAVSAVAASFPAGVNQS